MKKIEKELRRHIRKAAKMKEKTQSTGILSKSIVMEYFEHEFFVILPSRKRRRWPTWAPKEQNHFRFFKDQRKEHLHGYVIEMYVLIVKYNQRYVYYCSKQAMTMKKISMMVAIARKVVRVRSSVKGNLCLLSTSPATPVI